MKAKEVLAKLASVGSAQTRRTYRRHGIGDPLYGVSYAELGKLGKRIRTDHDLAVELWASGNHDARVLATMVADPEAAKARDLDAWAKDLDNDVITDALAGYVARTALSRKKMEKWARSKNEWIGRAGWRLLAHLAMDDGDLTDEFFENHLETIEREIHSRKNRVRDAMNGALIAIGIRSSKLEKKVVAAAKRIGKIEVDHGETNCKTPDAVEYIQRAKKKKRAARRATHC